VKRHAGPQRYTDHLEHQPRNREHGARPDIVEEHSPQQTVLRLTAAIVTREPACNPDCGQTRAADSAHDERFGRRLPDTKKEPYCHGRENHQR
jgi:hypothetical protein